MSLHSNHKMRQSQSYNFFILNFAQQAKALAFATPSPTLFKPWLCPVCVSFLEWPPPPPHSYFTHSECRFFFPRSVHFMDGGVGSVFYLCLGSRDKRSADYLGSLVRPWCRMVRWDSARKCSSFTPMQRKATRLLTILALGRED